MAVYLYSQSCNNFKSCEQTLLVTSKERLVLTPWLAVRAILSFRSLEPMALNIMLDSALSKERIRVNIPAVFTVAIGKDTTYHKKGAADY